MRYDKGDPNATGYERYDHYHRGHRDLRKKYYDCDGTVYPKGHDRTHLSPPEEISWYFGDI